MRRIVSVWLPDWPVTVWSRGSGRAPPETQAFALTLKGAHGVALHALNPAARALGLSAGQSHADACAAFPALVSHPADPEQDRKALRSLALWAERFSPIVAVDAEIDGLEGLLIDITGCAHLFGGEAGLLRELGQRLAKAGIDARCALADTAGAAWAIARFSGGRLRRVPPEGARASLAPLPLAALRLSPEAVRLLARLGLKRIGDLYGLPRAGLARRFGDAQGLDLVRRLDQALGDAPEPLIPERPTPRYRQSRVFAEPMIEAQGAAHWASDLANGLVEQLLRDGMGARRLRLTAFRLDGATTSIEATLSAPSAQPAHLIRLLKERGYEHLDLGFGADALMLSAPIAEPLPAKQTDFEAKAQQALDALDGLIDRLSARLSPGAVLAPRFENSWLPERSETWAPAPARADAAPGPVGQRPILVFHPPQPVEAIAELPDASPARFTWRRVSRRIVRAEGPERLSPEWWRPAKALRLGAPDEEPRTRDYYRVEDETGRRYWLFREGLYGREDTKPGKTKEAHPEPRPPTWWIQGVFP